MEYDYLVEPSSITIYKKISFWKRFILFYSLSIILVTISTVLKSLLFYSFFKWKSVNAALMVEVEIMVVAMVMVDQHLYVLDITLLYMVRVCVIDMVAHKMTLL